MRLLSTLQSYQKDFVHGAQTSLIIFVQLYNKVLIMTFAIIYKKGRFKQK